MADDSRINALTGGITGLALGGVGGLVLGALTAFVRKEESKISRHEADNTVRYLGMGGAVLDMLLGATINAVPGPQQVASSTYLPPRTA